MHVDDFGLDVEIAQLQLDQPRHRFERFGGIAGLPRRRIVEQRQRRQLLRRRTLEQRDLALLLVALALLDLVHDRLDLRRRPARDAALLLADDFAARLLHFAARLDLRARW